MVKKRVEVHYSGRVQGVGFRFTAERFAVAHKLPGFVRNLPDGRVELVVEGEEKEISQLLEALNADLGNYIDKYAINWFPATGEFTRFEIRSY